MKIEMGESLIYSWLRHEKLCQLVQTNWKVSPFWELENRQEIEDLFVICRNYFLEKHSLDISKGCSLEQFLKQAEIDGIGIAYSTEAPYIYAVDVAYHEGGLNYGGKDETITKIAQKCIRTALCLYGYFCMSTGEVLFVSPKITPAIETALVPLFDEISKLLHDNGLNIKAILHCNDSFSSEVMYPVVEKASAVADTSELFMRGLQLYNLATKVEPKRDEISSVTTTQCKLKPTSWHQQITRSGRQFVGFLIGLLHQIRITIELFELFCNFRRNVALCVGQSWKLVARIPRVTQMCM